jgi:hypothetical protein
MTSWDSSNMDSDNRHFSSILGPRGPSVPDSSIGSDRKAGDCLDDWEPEVEPVAVAEREAPA